MQAVVQQRPLGYTPRRDSGLAGYERVLSRAGLAPVAGVDEAGRGACAGPLVVAAAILEPSRSAAITGIPGLADSKALTAQLREEIYGQIVAVGRWTGAWWSSRPPTSTGWGCTCATSAGCAGPWPA